MEDTNTPTEATEEVAEESTEEKVCDASEEEAKEGEGE